MFTSGHGKHCNYRIINTMQDIAHNNIGFQIAH